MDRRLWRKSMDRRTWGSCGAETKPGTSAGGDWQVAERGGGSGENDFFGEKIGTSFIAHRSWCHRFRQGKAGKDEEASTAPRSSVFIAVTNRRSQTDSDDQFESKQKLPAEVNKLKHERHPSRSTGSGGTSVSSSTIDISARLQHRRLLFSAELGPCSLYHRSRQLLLLLRSRLCGHQSSHQVN
ncbi:hypothetical protein LXL04_024773 [Taraxacum kok-saghyz]